MSSHLFTSRLLLALLLLCTGLLSACTKEAEESDVLAETETARTRSSANDIPLGKLPGHASPTHYQLDLVIDPDRDSFSGSAVIQLTLHQDMDGLWLHSDSIEMKKIWLVHADDQKLELPVASFSQKESYGTSRLEFGQTIAAGDVSIGFEYEAPFANDLLGLHVVKADGVRYATSQLEMISARRVFPGFDEPRFKTTFDISIKTRSEFVAVTNTPVISEVEAEGWRTTKYARTPVLPTYLLAFVVGPWEIVTWEDIPATDLRSTPLPLRGITSRGNGDKIRVALAGSADLVLELERYFGVPYPFKKLDIVAVPDFAFGAMENAGLITYRDNLLLINEDSPASQKKAYIGVHAHELAHQWFGNRVTMPWWNDIWLNESFATWAGTRAANAVHPEFKFDSGLQSSAIAVMSNDSLASVRKIGEAVNNSDDILSAFDGITYQKGGAVLRMFESFVGPEKFQEAVHYHLERFPYGSATAVDFFESVEHSTGVAGVKEAFSSFINQRGVPLVNVNVECDDGGAQLRVKQERYLPLGSTAEKDQSWRLPLCYAVEVDGQRSSQCELLGKTETKISLPACPDWVIPNGNGMGYYRWALDSKSLAQLAGAFDQLSEGEQLSFSDSIAASVSAGKTGFSDYMQAIPAMLRSNNQAVVTAPMPLWSWIHDRLSAEAKQNSAALIVDSYSGLLVDLNNKDRLTPSQENIKREVTGFVARFGRDVTVRERLAKKAIEFLSSEDRLETVQWDNMAIALTIAIEDVSARETGFGSVVERIQTLFHKTERSVIRNAMLQALAGANTEESTLAARVMVFDARLKINEVPALLEPLGGGEFPENNWLWLTTNFDRIVPRVPQSRLQRFPRYASGFCSAKDAQMVNDFFVTRIDTLLGARRSLTQTLESINLCAAMRAHHLGDAEHYFKTLKI